MKKKVITIGSVILVLLILFIPIPHGTYRDGGTKDYCALTYRVVEWNRFIYECVSQSYLFIPPILSIVELFIFSDRPRYAETA